MGTAWPDTGKVLLSDFSVWEKIAGVAEQYDFELDSLQTAWLPTLVSVLCLQPARGLGPGSVRMAGGDSLPAPGSVPRRHGALWLPWFRLRALSPDTEALPRSGRSSRGQPGSYRVGHARRAGKHWTLPTWGHPPRPCGARGPIIGPLYPVTLLFIPGPEVWGFKPHKAWTRCPGP